MDLSSWRVDLSNTPVEVCGCLRLTKVVIARLPGLAFGDVCFVHLPHMLNHLVFPREAVITLAMTVGI
jgi:hypothetical protein